MIHLLKQDLMWSSIQPKSVKLIIIRACEIIRPQRKQFTNITLSRDPNVKGVTSSVDFVTTNYNVFRVSRDKNNNLTSNLIELHFCI